MKWLALLGPSTNVVKAARRLGHPIFVIGPEPDAVNYLEHPYDEYLQVDYRDLDELQSVCEEVLIHRDLVWLTAFAEDAQLPAAWARQWLGLPGPSVDLVDLTVDKYRMRQRLSERAPDINIPFCSAADREAAREMWQRFGALIAKPRAGVGSEGIVRIHSPEELEAYLADADDNAMLERFVDGVELVVDTHIVHGECTHIVIAGKWMSPESIDLGLVVPAPIDTDTRLRVEAAVNQMIDALELDTASIHSEVLVTPGGVVIIETHTRPAGDGLADLVYAVSGVDWRASALDVGITGAIHRDDARVDAAAAVFWTAPPGRVVEVKDTPPPVRGQVEMWLIWTAVGDSIGPTLSNDDRLGAAMVTGADLQTVIADVDALLASEIVRTEPIA